MTASIVDGLHQLNEHRKADDDNDETAPGQASTTTEPSLSEPVVGKPISHSQIVDLWKSLDASDTSSTSYSLEKLLQGSRVFIPPPPPKPEPSEEYKALMARLRREEDNRSYERMINPPPVYETFQSHFPNAAQAFAEVNRPSNAADIGDDDVTVNEIHRQVMLIINFLVSIVGVAATLWIVGRWWSLPSRLFLTMGGSIVVAIAEVAVYSGYMWRLDQAKQRQSAVKEIKQVVKTWVVGQDDESVDDEKTVLLQDKNHDDNDGTVRKRNIAPSEGIVVS
ncbi:hypothetical protein PT974_03861 [Cladobotryum mycophilum]|uniref:ATPase, vacuolar ER assembly factor, Vma12 n=1 Tax=Cladobotryum mycophilum TaxID=491253 RepID=A0ABR0STH8_9HYPO